MLLDELEKSIYHCPYVSADVCTERLKCHPIPGCGTAKPIYVLLGLNPASRENIWKSCGSIEELKKQFMKECMDPRLGYGKLIAHLESQISDFRIGRTVYLTDLVKCPTNKNVPPSDEMIQKCKGVHWDSLISALNPKYVIVLGNKLAKAIGGFDVYKLEAKTSQLSGNKAWYIFSSHPSQKGTGEISDMARNLAKAIKNPSISKFSNVAPSTSSSRNNQLIKIARIRIQDRLIAAGYRKNNSKMEKDSQSINIVCSSEFGDSLRVSWYCNEWKNDYATIYDYSAGDGPTCIVPLEKLFASKFIKDLKKRESYKNNKGYWTTTFSLDKEIAKLVLSYKNRWDLL